MINFNDPWTSQSSSNYVNRCIDSSLTHRFYCSDASCHERNNLGHYTLESHFPTEELGHSSLIPEEVISPKTIAPSFLSNKSIEVDEFFGSFFPRSHFLPAFLEDSRIPSFESHIALQEDNTSLRGRVSELERDNATLRAKLKLVSDGRSSLQLNALRTHGMANVASSFQEQVDELSKKVCQAVADLRWTVGGQLDKMRAATEVLYVDKRVDGVGFGKELCRTEGEYEEDSIDDRSNHNVEKAEEEMNERKRKRRKIDAAE